MHSVSETEALGARERMLRSKPQSMGTFSSNSHIQEAVLFHFIASVNISEPRASRRRFAGEPVAELRARIWAQDRTGFASTVPICDREHVKSVAMMTASHFRTNPGRCSLLEICFSRRSLVVRSAMSLRSTLCREPHRKSISAMMTPHGGIGSPFIRPSPLAHWGYALISFRQVRTRLRTSKFETQNCTTWR